MDDVVYISLTEMSERIRAKRLSPVELVDAHLARITQLNPKVNAFVTVDKKRAREQAKSADAALSSSENQILSALSTVCQSQLKVLLTSRAYHANAAAS